MFLSLVEEARPPHTDYFTAMTVKCQGEEVGDIPLILSGVVVTWPAVTGVACFGPAGNDEAHYE
jgi:hypothetical protein